MIADFPVEDSIAPEIPLVCVATKGPPVTTPLDVGDMTSGRCRTGAGALTTDKPCCDPTRTTLGKG